MPPDDDRRAPSEQVTILGSTVDLLPLDRVLDRIEGWIDRPDGTCHQIVVTGFHGLWEASKDPELQRVLNAADLWVPDGIAPVWIARSRGHRGAVRLSGGELMQAVFERGAARGTRHYFYGDTVEVLDALQHRIESKWPGNRVVGAVSPPFRDLSPSEVEAYVDAINVARPDVLWVGLGMPKQDLWIHEHAGRLQVPVAIGVGAAFAFVAGTVRRAPAWVGRAGLEWAYRLVQEPRKCWRRSLVEGPQFIYRVLREESRLRRSR